MPIYWMSIKFTFGRIKLFDICLVSTLNTKCYFFNFSKKSIPAVNWLIFVIHFVQNSSDDGQLWYLLIFGEKVEQQCLLCSMIQRKGLTGKSSKTFLAPHRLQMTDVFSTNTQLPMLFSFIQGDLSKLLVLANPSTLVLSLPGIFSPTC